MTVHFILYITVLVTQFWNVQEISINSPALKHKKIAFRPQYVFILKIAHYYNQKIFLIL